jgi:hypothetical protein
MLGIILGIHDAAKAFGGITGRLYPIVADGLLSNARITAAA